METKFALHTKPDENNRKNYKFIELKKKYKRILVLYYIFL